MSYHTILYDMIHSCAHDTEQQASGMALVYKGSLTFEHNIMPKTRSDSRPVVYA